MLDSNFFMGQPINWWVRIKFTLDRFEIKDADHLAYVLRVRQRLAEKEKTDEQS